MGCEACGDLLEEAAKGAMCAHCAHRAALVSELSVTQQALALLNERVSLPVVQILQLVDVVPALRLSLLHVDVRQHTLHDGDLKNTRNEKMNLSHVCRSTSCV